MERTGLKRGTTQGKDIRNHLGMGFDLLLVLFLCRTMFDLVGWDRTPCRRAGRIRINASGILFCSGVSSRDWIALNAGTIRKLVN